MALNAGAVSTQQCPSCACGWPTLFSRSPVAALAALERQAGIIYDSDKLPQGSELMQLLWRKVGEEAAAGDSGAARVLTVEEEEDLMRSSEGECPCTVSRRAG